MNSMTDEAVRALLDIVRTKGDAAPRIKSLARALLDARAELAQAKADAAAAVTLAVEKAAERLEANRAHLNFEALLSLMRDEALPEPVVTALSNWLDGIAAAIRALAPADGLAEVAKLRAEQDDLRECLKGADDRNLKLGQRLQDAGAEVASLNGKVAGLVEAVIWCSGSNDFQEGGVAREGWLKLCAPMIQPATKGEPE